MDQKGLVCFLKFKDLPPPPPSVIETKLLIPLFCLFGNIFCIINSMRESLMKQPFDIKHYYINIDKHYVPSAKNKIKINNI